MIPDWAFEPKLTKNALSVLENRYLKKETNETPREMFYRVASNVSLADRLYSPEKDLEEVTKEFYELMANMDFLPNSPTLINAGREHQQLSGCFVLPVGDSVEEIFSTLKDAALIHNTSGGTGFSFSRLRPKDDIVQSTSGVASGPIYFMEIHNLATEVLKRGGSRRGANMGILKVDHPDIIDFICSKGDLNERTKKLYDSLFSEKNESAKRKIIQQLQLNNFNISVAVTDGFMNAVKENRDYPLINPRTKEVVKELNAKEVFDLIVEYATRNGEPGVVFLDKINETNPTPEIGEIESTNPCGEQPLLPYESCNLGSINLSNFVKEKDIDFQRLESIVKKAVHFLDNVIDVNKFPLEKIEKITKANRKIGLGVMGFADMLIKLSIPYNSEEAIKTAEDVIKFISEKSKEASAELAKERGKFPNFDKSVYKYGVWLRNAATTTIAPTGTISVIAGCSSGIEPLFALAYTRKVKDTIGVDLEDVNPLFVKLAKERGFYNEDLIKELAEGKIQSAPEDIKKIFVTAHDISPKYHIRMQAAFQKYIDNAVSKTVNFPSSASNEDVKKVFLLAYDLGCKGATIYRDKSRDVQVLNVGVKAKNDYIQPKKRAKKLGGTTPKIKTACGTLYVTLNEDEEGNLIEVFARLGKAGGCSQAQTEAIGRGASLALRAGVDPFYVWEQCRGVGCGNTSIGQVKSCADGVALAIENYLIDKIESKQYDGKFKEVFEKRKVNEKSNFVQIVSGACPDCGGQLEYNEGCVTCRLCGYSKCS